MQDSSSLVSDADFAGRLRKSRWPARLDLAQSVTGLVLVLFLYAHMFFESSILISNDAMWTMTKFFEGYYFFGTAYPWIVSIVAALVLALIVAHAALALRKFPISYRQYKNFRDHAQVMQHEDTKLWFWQVFTGFALFFLASAHVFTMITSPDRIGPFESADRVWSEHLWPFYIVLLLTVLLHANIGLYRLAVKWGWLASNNANATRPRLKLLMWASMVFFIVLGFATLATYTRIGIEHESHYGERYVPSHLQAPPQPVAPAERIGAGKNSK